MNHLTSKLPSTRNKWQPVQDIMGIKVIDPDYGFDGLEICQVTGIDHKTSLPCNYATAVNARNGRLIAKAPEIMRLLDLTLHHLQKSEPLRPDERIDIVSTLAYIRGL